MRDEASRFDMSESTVYRVLQRVAQFLMRLGPSVIKFPADLENLTSSFEKELHGEATGRKIGNLVLDALKSRAEKGAACLPAKFDEVLVDIFYYLEKSAKRKDRLVEFQGMHNTEVRNILKHVPTRWLLLGRCLTRLLEQWQPLVSFFLNETKPKSQQHPSFLGSYQIPKRAAASADVRDEVQRDHQKRKEPRGKIDATPAKKVKLSSESTGRASLNREERLLYFLTSNVNFAYGLFLKSVIPVFDKVNAQLQSQAPEIHLLQVPLEAVPKGPFG
ncbi:hypothetical protein MRX96_043712 [Rhipicephalus microplus]